MPVCEELARAAVDDETRKRIRHAAAFYGSVTVPSARPHVRTSHVARPRTLSFARSPRFQRVRQDELRHLAPDSGTDFVRGAEMNS